MKSAIAASATSSSDARLCLSNHCIDQLSAEDEQVRRVRVGAQPALLGQCLQHRHPGRLYCAAAARWRRCRVERARLVVHDGG
jgi:hypothetical protein